MARALFTLACTLTLHHATLLRAFRLAGQGGHCRRACGLCSPTQLLAASAPTLAAELEALASALLLAAKNIGCGASRACLTGVSGTAVGAGLVQVQVEGGQRVDGAAPPGRELPPGLKQMPGEACLPA